MFEFTKILAAVLACLLVGCATDKPPDLLKHRRPVPAEWQRAVDATRHYVLSKSLLSPAQLAKLKPDAGFISVRQQREILYLEFYDPVRFPEDKWLIDGHFSPMAGGFPAYFRATIDMRTWQVTDFYGERE